MKKGIAIRTVILLILGIVVVGLVGYWLFITGGKMGGEMSLEDCRVKVITEYCPDVREAGEYSTFNIKGCTVYAEELGVDSKSAVEKTCGIEFPEETPE